MKITVVTTMRNEGRHLLEWVAHHQAIGVTDFLVYTNDCEDSTEVLLDLLPTVEHVRLEPGAKPPQWRALRAAWTHPLVEGADWVACIDCDEFLNLDKGIEDIPHLISRADADAIMLPWRLFGNNGLVDFDPGLTTAKFTQCAPKDMLYPAIGSYFKTLFRRDGNFRQLGVHRPKQKSAERHSVPRWVDGSGVEVSGPLAENDGQIMNWGKPIARNLVQLNHYSVRSVSDFMVKRARGLPNHQTKTIDLTYWVERNFNSTEDLTILDRSSQVLKFLNEIRSIPGVSDAEVAATRWAERKLEELLKESDELNLFGRLILAGSSTPPSQDKSMDLIRAYQVANG